MRPKPASPPDDGSAIAWDPHLEERIQFLVANPGASSLLEAMLEQMKSFAWKQLISAQDQSDLFQAQGFSRAVDGLQRRLFRYRKLSEKTGMHREITVTS